MNWWYVLGYFYIGAFAAFVAFMIIKDYPNETKSTKILTPIGVFFFWPLMLFLFLLSIS